MTKIIQKMTSGAYFRYITFLFGFKNYFDLLDIFAVVVSSVVVVVEEEAVVVVVLVVGHVESFIKTYIFYLFFKKINLKAIKKFYLLLHLHLKQPMLELPWRC
jgi:hypothetical protein